MTTTQTHNRIAMQDEVLRWLEYLKAANMVAFDEIRALDQVPTARKFCKCLSVGWFIDVSDLQIWNALQVMNAKAKMKAS